VPTSVVSADRYVVEAEYRNSDLEADEYPVEFLCGRYSLSLAPARALSAPGFNDYLIKHTIRQGLRLLVQSVFGGARLTKTDS